MSTIEQPLKQRAMIERHSKVFVPVSVDTKLPSMDLDRFIAMTDTGYASMFRRAEPNDSKHRGFLKDNGITHWLEEKENVYVLTEDELKEEKKKEAIAFAEWKDNNFFTDENILPYFRQYQVSKDYVEGDAKLFDYKDIYELFNPQK